MAMTDALATTIGYSVLFAAGFLVAFWIWAFLSEYIGFEFYWKERVVGVRIGPYMIATGSAPFMYDTRVKMAEFHEKSYSGRVVEDFKRIKLRGNLGLYYVYYPYRGWK
jgi:hypothetical protein